MRKTIVSTALAAAVALAVSLVAWSAVTAGGTASNANGSVQQFTSLAAAGVEVDYTPLTSPADAVRKADLIVQGTLVKVADGIRVDVTGQKAQRRANSYATFVVSVQKVVSGDASKVTNGRVYLQVFKSGAASTQELSDLNPGAKVVAVLDDISTWRPARNAQVARPAAVPAQASLYAPYNDGLWLQGGADNRMYGIGVDLDDLTTSWSGTRTVDQFTTKLNKAAQSN